MLCKLLKNLFLLIYPTVNNQKGLLSSYDSSISYDDHKKVYGQHKRYKFIFAKNQSRAEKKSNTFKTDYFALFSKYMGLSSIIIFV